jgi:hypothetical protein
VSSFFFFIIVCVYLWKSFSYFFFIIIVIDCIDQYCQGKMDCMFMFVRYIKIVILFFGVHTRAICPEKRKKRSDSDVIAKFFCCSHRILEEAQRERHRQEKQKKVVISLFSFFSLSVVRKIDFLVQLLP